MKSMSIAQRPPMRGSIQEKARGPARSRPPVKGSVPDKAKGPGPRSLVDPRFESLAQNYQSGGIEHHEMSHLVSAALADIRKASDPRATARAYIERFGEMFAIEQEAQALYRGFAEQAAEAAARASKKPKMNSSKV